MDLPALSGSECHSRERSGGRRRDLNGPCCPQRATLNLLSDQRHAEIMRNLIQHYSKRISFPREPNFRVSAKIHPPK